MISVEEARQHYHGSDAVHDFDHVLRVLALAERLAPAEGADLEILRAAVLLHDVARGDGGEAEGVARAFAYGGRAGQRLWAEVPPGYQESQATRGEHTPVHEYHMKLVRIQDRLLTESAREIARERHAFMVAFFERLDLEVRGLV